MRSRRRWVIVAISVLFLGLGGFWVARVNTQPSPLTVAATAQTPTDKAQPSIPNASIVFDSVRPKLKDSQTPLRLPTYIPSNGQRKAAQNGTALTVYAGIVEVPPQKGFNSGDKPPLSQYEPTLGYTKLVRKIKEGLGAKPGYEVTLGYTPDCTGGNACRLGTVAGEPKPAQSIEQTYAFMQDSNFKGRRSQEPMSQVMLANGVQGWFIPWICGANCNDAKVVWDEGLSRYTVGIKLGDRASLVRMANSAIENREGQ